MKNVLNIAVIGCGNMATPIVKTIAKNEPNIRFHTYTPSKVRALELATSVNGTSYQKIIEIPDDEIDFWLIGCKPQQLNSLSRELGKNFKDKKIISMLASIEIDKLKRSFNSNEIIRIMPNTPVAHGLGISLMISSKDTNIKDSNLVEKLFEYCGQVIKVDSETSFDELTVFSGSGPAYIFRFAQAYFKKLTDMGFDSKLSRQLINQLFLGSSHLMENNQDNLQTMIDQVTSKAGVTIEAVQVLESSSIDRMVSVSIDAAINRGKQISQDNN